MELTEEQIVEAMMLESRLTLREAMILIALVTGSYDKAGIGTTRAEDLKDRSATGEDKLIALGLIVNTARWLEPTPKGTAMAEWFMAVLHDVTEEQVKLV